MERRIVPIGSVKPNPDNPRVIKDDKFKKLVQSLKDFPEMTQVRELVVNQDMVVLGGNMRLKAMQEAGWTEVPVKVVDWSEEKQREFVVKDNASFGEWDFDALGNMYEPAELDAWGVDLPDFEDIKEVEEDEAPEVNGIEPARSQLGDIYQLGRHRLMCGDATKQEDVELLMDGKKADMVFTDPPYGINKDIKNDNLNIGDLVIFNGEWLVNAVKQVKDCGYVYVWGYFQVLAETWVKVIKPLEKVGFRNFVVWKKRGKVQGMNNKDFRMFPPSYEACLVFVWGQQFGNGAWSSTPNAEFYWDGYEPIRLYLDGERQKMSWDIPIVKKMVGHSDLSGDHWFSKSQWSMITESVYVQLQAAAKGQAFTKQYDELRKQYDELRKQYDELRGYFDNSHGFTDIWEFDSETGDENHPTVKPIEACERGITASSRQGEIVLDLFGGSGSTLIACEQLNRTCYMMELDPKYCDVIRKRYWKLTHDGNEDGWEVGTPVITGDLQE